MNNKSINTEKSTQKNLPVIDVSNFQKDVQVHKNIHLDDPDLYINREISWLTFNERVLSEAENKLVPLIERLKFCIIFASNLDEFFMVRISGLLRLVSKPSNSLYYDEEDSEEMLDEVAIKVRGLLKRLSKCLQNEILPELGLNNITIPRFGELTRSEEEKLDIHFESQVFPVLTPLAIDPAHPFPYLSNLSLYLAVTFEGVSDNGEPLLALVEVPQKIMRLIPISQKVSKQRFFLLDELIKNYMPTLFPWTQVTGAYAFRVTRNLDYQLLDHEVKDLMKSIEYELKDREQKTVVRLEYEKNMPDWLRNKLAAVLDLDSSDLYEIEGMINIRDLAPLLKIERLDPYLKDEAFNPRLNINLVDASRDIFDIIKERDILLHHPYDSFASVLDFLRSAAKDEKVLAIKQTLYRSGGDSPIIEALANAAERGKQVTVVVELKARFDEANNIEWAKRLERAGAHVVFGFIDLKTHAKCTLVVRKEKNNYLQKYVHLSTGNYNSSTAKLYTDIGHLTTDPILCDDVANVFNFITGFNILRDQDLTQMKIPHFEKIKVAPFRLREQIIQMIENEKKKNCSENQSHIIFKMNSLVDVKLCQALYRASQKGVKIDLIIRGICILRPDVPGVSENIRVISVIDRFLEHSRIFWFKNGGDPLIFCGSADLMERNMDRRIEIVWPIESPELKSKLTGILTTFLLDNCKSHEMQSDGTYIRKLPILNEKVYRSQDKFIEYARRYGIKSIAYDQAIKPLFEKKDFDRIPERFIPSLVVEELSAKSSKKKKKK
ncbi:polyphosphate kinase 1 [Pigmentibacter sp. JX0631]|uniref:polyphosphate kinase 1 n=1 Tax=Pigmentibacter sp. JX0631 TaxID=2976982 RepID=UPI002468702D|nr:polyphosphate kinase 1 [Pigmentibacter sp. JX0631]WGL61530.1 polyphosphate kinase 1 [Pigmentibacter sp. JX0631]